MSHLLEDHPDWPKNAMNTPTPMTAERLNALLNSSMVEYIASRTTEDWVALGEVHPAAIVREMAVKILMQERDLAAAQERAKAAEALAEAIQNGSENNKERTEHLEWRTKLANDLDECERMRDVLARTVNVLDAENKELRSAETVAWMICEPECKYGSTFGTENAAWSALTKAPPGSELVELVKR